MNEMYRKRPNSLGTIASSISTPDIVNPNIQFEDLPTPVGKPPYHLSLSQILTTEEINRIHENGAISFHIVGDTGGTKKPENQKIVEMAMEYDFKHKDKTKIPSFFYHLGDVIYKFGEASQYYSQFYEPYQYYPAPIFAIPGNKDGSIRKSGSNIVLDYDKSKNNGKTHTNDNNNKSISNPANLATVNTSTTNKTLSDKSKNNGKNSNNNKSIPGNPDTINKIEPYKVPSLKAFMDNFCAKTQHIGPDAEDVNRSTMIQPNVYWTLEAPFLNIVGLYSNVPDGGEIRDPQFNWFVEELKNAPTDKALIVCVHHTPFAVDDKRSGSEYILNRLDSAFQISDRIPDIIFAGHVHNYQRFTRTFDGREIPYLVAGMGGHWDLNYMQKHQDDTAIEVPYKVPDREDLILENYCDNRHGFMRIQVTSKKIIGKFFAASRSHESWRKPSKKLDEFELDLQKHKIK